MPYHACARRRWRRRPAGVGAGAGPGSGSGPGSGPGSGSGSGFGLGSLPGLVLFESGLKGMGRSAPPTNRSASVGLPTVATVGLPTDTAAGRKVASFPRIGTCWPLLECYIKHSKLSIEIYQQQSLSLSI